VSDDELRRHLTERRVSYKVPRTFDIVDEPLHDDAGKVRRSRVREEAIARHGTTPSSVPIRET
jgi:bile acid-coenzyme A ligase